MTIRSTRDAIPIFINAILHKAREDFQHDRRIRAKVKKEGITFEEFAAFTVSEMLYRNFVITPREELN